MAEPEKVCPGWVYGILGFSRPTRIPCGGKADHEPPHRYAIEWTETEPAERWVNGVWYRAPVLYTTPDKTCLVCAEKAAANHGAWPCHRCDHSFHMGPCPSTALSFRAGADQNGGDSGD